jgi:hypothetical protein
MKEQEYQGTFLRSTFCDSGFVVVLEPNCDGFPMMELEGLVTELRFDWTSVSDNIQAYLQKNCGEWLCVKIQDDGQQVIAHFEDYETLSHQMVSSHQVVSRECRVEERGYDIDDLKAKCEILADSLDAFRNLAGETQRRLNNFRNRLTRYISANFDRWSKRRDFFSSNNPDKARLYEERLTVLAEIESALKWESDEI